MNRFLSIFNKDNFWSTVMYLGLVGVAAIGEYFASIYVLLFSLILFLIYMATVNKVEAVETEDSLKFFSANNKRELNLLATVCWPLMMLVNGLVIGFFTGEFVLSLDVGIPVTVAAANLLLLPYLYFVWFNIPLSIFFNPKFYFHFSSRGKSRSSSYTPSTGMQMTNSPKYSNLSCNIHHHRRK